jgi:hypothetical protein
MEQLLLLHDCAVSSCHFYFYFLYYYNQSFPLLPFFYIGLAFRIILIGHRLVSGLGGNNTDQVVLEKKKQHRPGQTDVAGMAGSKLFPDHVFCFFSREKEKK